ncbi:MAG: hypothetical protein A3H91_16285 [Gammaproteobacteria bacterium RIFCSPLOWO2_02_FULL_61_13]|nr:MAG: hypothetical protein A3H91_16285 [Gammaproteobacteria bacterium RIFCSPLOWO2_02_FULL_61_13]
MNTGIFLLCLGLALWMGVHFIPSLAPAWRVQRVEKMGLGPWKGLFSVLIVTSLVLIVMGWRGTPPEILYLPPAWGRHVAMTLMIIALLLFFAGRLPTNLKRVLRHPQLTGVTLWALAHLLANGEVRSLVLFIGLGAWALLEMVVINRRVGPWVRPQPVPVVRDVVLASVALVVYGLLLYLHKYIAGISLLSG